MAASIQFDGACRNNPGPAGIGYYIEIGSEEIEGKEYIGECTNNEAEYKALIASLEHAVELECADVVIEGDAELVVKQVTGDYSVNAENLQPLHEKVMELKQEFESFHIYHQVREQNERADSLANAALDED
ncbi:ribonuclease HI family protein [Natrinema salsiterrestre]|uniref:Ribonuclease HI family protein n=1 Tax=Natrinema salsiterrestre TaxID=2950540 RepID=A0A9Q4Q0P7_9EURY|nr:ribonuclease HI family protein [Natrinema salsiterrestre]MDF9744526.1 ribonuclease HI family protein [Natrinema salsiterrestre]